MTNFKFSHDSIHSKTTESCLLLFSCILDMGQSAPKWATQAPPSTSFFHKQTVVQVSPKQYQPTYVCHLCGSASGLVMTVARTDYAIRRNDSARPVTDVKKQMGAMRTPRWIPLHRRPRPVGRQIHYLCTNCTLDFRSPSYRSLVGVRSATATGTRYGSEGALTVLQQQALIVRCSSFCLKWLTPYERWGSTAHQKAESTVVPLLESRISALKWQV